MSAAEHEYHEPPRSAALAFILGLLFGGVALFYVAPFGKALRGALIGYLLVALSGGTLWVPVFLGIGFYAARLAKATEKPLGFHPDESVPLHVSDDLLPEMTPTPPGTAYVHARYGG